MANESNKIAGAFVLTPAEGKKVIGMGVAALPEVKNAYEKEQALTHTYNA